MGVGRGALLWLIGVPLPIIILLVLFWRWSDGMTAYRQAARSGVAHALCAPAHCRIDEGPRKRQSADCWLPCHSCV